MNMVQLNDNAFIVQSHVGQVIMSTTLDTEAKVKQYYGGTSWTKIEGRFLLGASSSYAVKGTGGEATHTLTVSEMPKHAHIVYGFTGGEDDGGGYTAGYIDDWGNRFEAQRGAKLYHRWHEGSFKTWGATCGEGTGDPCGNAKSVGGGGSHNNMPPYYAVYIWVRTA